MKAGQGGSGSMMGRCRLDVHLPWDTAAPQGDTAPPLKWRGGGTYKFAVYRGTSPSAVTFCGTVQGTRRAFTQRRWWLLKP